MMRFSWYSSSGHSCCKLPSDNAGGSVVDNGMDGFFIFESCCGVVVVVVVVVDGMECWLYRPGQVEAVVVVAEVWLGNMMG